jgi:mevalonate kinase
MRLGVDRLISAWEKGEVRPVLATLAELDPLFEAWSQEEGLLLMTESMAKMRELAHEEGGICRISGAGGGDSLLVFSDDAAVLKRIQGRWDANGFQTLELTLEP